MMGLVGGAVGAIGGILGITSWLTARRGEQRAREEQDAMWRMYVDLLKSSGTVAGASVWSFDIGTRNHELAERMVERRLLDRVPRGGGYCLNEALSDSTSGTADERG
jgi:hypothetical protein